MTPQDLASLAQQADDFADEIFPRDDPEWREIRMGRLVSLIQSHVGMEWKNAALRVGEELSDVGPLGYYGMRPDEWQDWALGQIRELKGVA